MLSTGGNLIADVSQDHLARNYSETTLVNRYDWTVTAHMFAATRCLYESDDSAAIIWHLKLCIFG